MLTTLLVSTIALQAAGTGYVHLTSGAPVKVPFEQSSNKIYLRAKVGGSGPYWFVLDSGMPGMALDMGLCKKLHLTTSDSSTVQGAGAGSIAAARIEAPEISLPGVRYKPRGPLALDLDPVMSPVEGRHLDGLIGGDFLSQTVVEIDYARKQLSFLDPATFRHSGPSSGIPLEIAGWMFIGGTVEIKPGHPVSGRFLVDTGDRLAITLNSPFVKQQALLSDTTPQMAVASGIGGIVKHGVTRIAALHMGSTSVNDFIGTLSTDTAGVFSADQFQGLIGAEILRRFRVTIDYPHKLLYLDPGGQPVGGEFDASGLFLKAVGPDFRSFEVLSVASGSPAAAAGIDIGDRILSIDGREANQLTLEDVRATLRRSGKSVRLAFSRRGAVTLKLRLPV
jgi:hypothetical protein